MKRVGGIYYRNGKAVGNNGQHFMLPENSVQSAVAPNVLLFSQQNTTICNNDTSFLVGDIDLYNSEELKKRLAIPQQSLINDDELVLKAYEKWGAECVGYLIGNFMFSIWDDKAGNMYCARDPLGQRPFYYYLDDNIFIFSNTIHFLASYSIAQHLNDKWLSGFLTQNRTDTDLEQTIYRDVKRLRPAHSVLINSGQCKEILYWELGNKKQQKTTNADEAAATIRKNVQDAVEWSLKNEVRAGVELSGGLDSGFIAALAHNHLKGGLSAYSNMLPAEYKDYFKGFSDESSAVYAICQYLGLEQHIIIDDIPQDPLYQVERALEAIGYPTYMEVNTYQQTIHNKASAEGLNVLLSGFGGDEMVSINSYKPYLRFLIRNHRFAEAVKAIRRKGFSHMKACTNVIYQYSQMMLGMNDDKKLKQVKMMVSSLFLKEKFVDNFDSVSEYSVADMKEWYKKKLGSSGLVERLETGYLITGSHGLLYKYPLLHLPLLEYYYSLPDEWNMDNKYGRALIRKALKGLLPENVVEADKARNTAVIPTIKVEVELYFDQLKEWLLSKPDDHQIFSYVDKNKLKALHRNDMLDMRIYAMLKRLAMLTMFLDKHKTRKYYSV